MDSTQIKRRHSLIQRGDLDEDQISNNRKFSFQEPRIPSKPKSRLPTNSSRSHSEGYIDASKPRQMFASQHQRKVSDQNTQRNRDEENIFPKVNRSLNFDDSDSLEDLLKKSNPFEDDYDPNFVPSKYLLFFLLENQIKYN